MSSKIKRRQHTCDADDEKDAFDDPNAFDDEDEESENLNTNSNDDSNLSIAGDDKVSIVGEKSSEKEAEGSSIDNLEESKNGGVEIRGNSLITCDLNNDAKRVDTFYESEYAAEKTSEEIQQNNDASEKHESSKVM